MYKHFFPAVCQNPKRHFFDNAATTQYCQAALDSSAQLDELPRANISRGVYREAERISELYEQARQSIAKIIGVKAHEIIFCRSTTDGLNIAARCLLENLQSGQGVLVSDAEHHSNFLPWMELCKQKKRPFYRLSLDENGAIDLAQLAQFEDKNIAVLAITHCSNLTGVITDMPSIAQWCEDHDIILVVDGAQMLQHTIPNLSQFNAHVYAFSGHKVFAGSGIGVLYANEQLLEKWQPVAWGGGMVLDIPLLHTCSPTDNQWLQTPQKFEAGTPSYQQAIILADTLKWLDSLDQHAFHQHHQSLFAQAENILQQYDFIDVIGHTQQPRHPIFAFNIRALHPHDAAQLFDQLGFCVRAGHHCAKPLMHHLGINACLRISLSCYNTLEELELFEHALKHIYKQSQAFLLS